MEGYITPPEKAPEGVSCKTNTPTIATAPTLTSNLSFIRYNKFSGLINTNNNVLFNSCAKDIATGLYDEVKITTGTESISPGQSVSYSANFTSGDNNTFPVYWNWDIKLYHNEGTFELGKSERNYFGDWTFTTNAALPDYQWARDPNGNIYGEVCVVVDINDGDTKSDTLPIAVKYKPNQPIINVMSYINQGDPLNNSVTFSIDSKGSVSYKVYYTSSKTAHQGISPITINNANVVNLSNLDYNDEFWVTGINGNGESQISNKLVIAKYLNLPLTFTKTADQILCVTKYGSNANTNVTINNDGSIDLDNIGWQTDMTGGADFHINLNNEKEVLLEFDWKHYCDTYHDEDGLFLSNNGGGSFKKIYSLNPETKQPNVFHHIKLNLDSLANLVGLDYSKSCVLRFSHKGNGPIPSEGFSFANIKLYNSSVLPSPINTLVLGIEKDALLAFNSKPGYEYIGDTNYGSYTRIRAEEWTTSGYRTNYKSLFDFDFSIFPKNTIIKSAKISLYANNPQPDENYKQMTQFSTGNSSYKSNASWLHRVIENWEENIVTYNSCPETSELNGEYLPVSEIYSQDYINVDVTNIVQDMINNPENSHGFMMSLAKEDKYSRMVFSSSDYTNSALHPKLTIEHYIEEQVFTIPFSVVGSTISESKNWDLQSPGERDKAYLVYVPTSIAINATTCSPITDFDTQLEIFKADKLSTGYYNDNDGVCNYNSLSSSVENITLSPGYYYFVVGGYGDACGNYSLSVDISSSLKNASLIESNISNEKVEDTENSDISIYPNPVKANLYVITPDAGAQINITDLNGRLLKTIQSQVLENIINCSDLKQGIYIVKTIVNGTVISKKFTKTE